MKRHNLQSLNYSDSLLSVFDIGGFLPRNLHLQSKGIEYDKQQLSSDLQALTEDYKKAREDVIKEVER